VATPAWSAADFGRVAVCAGGDSAEREISLRSGAAVAEALQAAGIDVQLVDLDKQFFEQAVAGNLIESSSQSMGGVEKTAPSRVFLI